MDAHPAWFHNFMAMATTEVDLPGNERRRVRSSVAGARSGRTCGSERWLLIGRTRYWPYATHTEREIPVVVIEPADADRGLGGQPS